MEQDWLDEIVEEWIDQATTYPEKALVYMVKQVYREQARRIELFQGHLDGSLWSRKEWQ